MHQACLFCGGNRDEKGHLLVCEGKQGALEAARLEATELEPPPKPKLLDAKRGRLLRDAGMARVDESAGEDYRGRLDAALFLLATTRLTFACDDVWPVFVGDANVRDKRALGPAMRRAKLAGWIKQVIGPVDYTKQPKSHSSYIVYWESLIYRGRKEA